MIVESPFLIKELYDESGKTKSISINTKGIDGLIDDLKKDDIVIDKKESKQEVKYMGNSDVKHKVKSLEIPIKDTERVAWYLLKNDSVEIMLANYFESVKPEMIQNFSKIPTGIIGYIKLNNANNVSEIKTLGRIERAIESFYRRP